MAPPFAGLALTLAKVRISFNRASFISKGIKKESIEEGNLSSCLSGK